MKLLVIHTGGTIASSYSENSVTLKENNALNLVEEYEGIEFEQNLLMNILSENMNAAAVGLICRRIYESVLSKKYDGIIVTHGSDTLSFTAAVCEYNLGKTEIPVIFTAANHPLEDPHSNGRDNFRAAIEAAKSLSGGVYAVWKNSDGKVLVCHGGNLCEADSYHDDFRLFMPEEDFCKSDNFKSFDPKNKVLFIKCYPMMDFRSFDMSGFAAAVVYLYHSATAPVEGEGSLCGFIRRCKADGKNVYLASFKEGTKLYETTDSFLSLGAKQLYNCSPERAYATALSEENA